MLRFGILLSVIPLVLAGGIPHDWTASSAHPCIPAGMTTIRYTPTSMPSARPIAFTSDPALATIKVQIVDNPELADLAIIDDVAAADADGCGIDKMTRLVTISDRPVPGEPVVYMSRDAGADYRIYVVSKKVSYQHAAALIVGARGGHGRLAAAAF
jgi:hypothetical protein